MSHDAEFRNGDLVSVNNIKLKHTVMRYMVDDAGANVGILL